MFNLSGSEIIVILLLALVVLGPDKLPEAMRKAGKTFAELKKLSTGFQDEVRKGFEEPTVELRKTANTIRDAATVPGVTKKSPSKNRPATYPDKPHYNPAVDPAPSLPEGSSVAVPLAEAADEAEGPESLVAADPAEDAVVVTPALADAEPAADDKPAAEVIVGEDDPAPDGAGPIDDVASNDVAANDVAINEGTAGEEAAVGRDVGA